MKSAETPKMNIVIVGHVDHGKSTIIGRLLADTGSLPDGKLAQVRAECKRTAKPFEYAFLLDALKDEQEQGITIDTARCFFKSKKREYIIIDAPGHIEFLKNMISGAARAEAALLVIDAAEGIRENSKRHGYLLSMLGIRQLAVVVNKMDLVGYKAAVFQKIKKDYARFLKEVGISAHTFVPVSGREGDNIMKPSMNLKWFKGPSILSVLDEFKKAPGIEDKAFRFPVQGVYRFTEEGDDRRLVVGRVESGKVSVGDPVVFLPSQKRSTIQSIEAFHAPKRKTAYAGVSTSFTLQEQVYVNRGEVMCKDGDALPEVSTLLRVELFWMGKSPLEFGREYKLKLATASTPVHLKKIVRVIDASDLKKQNKKKIERHDVAQCILDCAHPIAFDLTEVLEATGRFVIVDKYDVAGGGIVVEALKDEQEAIREQVKVREEKWDFSVVDPLERATRYGHKPQLVLLTGKVGVDKKTIAKDFDKALFDMGARSYFLGIGNLLRGLNSDIETDKIARHEHARRLGEVAHLFMDAGLIVVATASNLNDEELRGIKQATNMDDVLIVNVGKNEFRHSVVDLNLPEKTNPAKNVEKIFELLYERKVLFGKTA
ncbi:MAG: GTP-binding protein [Candidatus Omnitrophota bacterium]|nr:GTP-binding protein [Candidatus Omnitrophota bacterium]